MRSKWPNPAILAAGLMVAALGGAVLVGWYVRFIPLIQAIPGGTPTHRMTALELLLSGAGLALVGASRKRAAAVCAVVVLLVAVLVLIEYALGTNFGIDELIGSDYLNVLTSHRGRMSPVSALCFVGVSIALMVTAYRRPSPPASTIVGVLGSLLTAVGAVSLMGQLLRHAETYGWSQLTRASPFTSAGVAVLGAGFMAWAWREVRENEGAPAWLPIGLGAGLAIGVLGVWQALTRHQESEVPLISAIILAGGLVASVLVSVAVAMAQQARKHNRALQVTEAAVRLGNEIFANMEEAVCLIRMEDGIIVHANPKFEKMFGYGPDELTGMRVIEINADTDRPAVEVAEQIRQEIRESRVWRGEILHRRKNGTLFWCAVTGSIFHHPEFGEVGISIHQDITERKKAEKKLSEQAALLDLAPDSIAVRDMENRIIFWNRGAQETYGWSVAEALGRDPQDLLHSRYPIPRDEIEAIVLKQGGWEGELEQTTRDGKVLVVASRWSLWRDEHGTPRAFLIINRDVTDRKRTEEELRSLTERLSLATRSASIGIWDWDLRSNTTVWDDTTFEMFGIPKMVPMPYEEFTRHVHPEDLPRVQDSLRTAVKGKTRSFVEFRIMRPDGSVRHLSAAGGAVLDEQDVAVRVVGTVVDITERKRLEAEVEANRVRLITSARLSALGMMAGNVAHEINNPVGIIHALASNLIDMVEQEEAVPPDLVTRNGRRIRETAERISGIVKSLLQISREGSGDRFHPARIGKILNGTIEICRERFRSNGVRLILPHHTPEFSVSCRETQIAQVLLNLLQNAFDAVVDQTGERWVRLDVVHREDSVVISVTDSGPGVPFELRSRIMEPFFTTKPVGKGTGLGLSLSKTIAEEHGGRLEFGENQGRTSFSLTLPMVREAEVVWN